jgi:hypothetical protein
MDPSISGTISATNELAGLLGTFAKVKQKLLAQPSAAAEKLAFVLNEIGKTFEVVETELSRLLVLGASPEALKNAMTSSENPLYELEGPKLRARVEQGRGHCHLIGNVYDEYLDKWLSRVLDPAEYQELQSVFDRLSEADDDLFWRLVSVSDYVETTARTTLDEAINEDWDSAHERLANARRDVRPLRTAIGTAMVQLYSLKNDFIDMSGTTVA